MVLLLLDNLLTLFFLIGGLIEIFVFNLIIFGVLFQGNMLLMITLLMKNEIKCTRAK